MSQVTIHVKYYLFTSIIIIRGWAVFCCRLQTKELINLLSCLWLNLVKLVSYWHNTFTVNCYIDSTFRREKLLNNVKNYTLIYGDMNPHHCGNYIFWEYSQPQFIMVNDNAFTTVPSKFHTQFVIYLTFNTSNLYANITKLNVLSDLMGSNHFSIIMQFEFFNTNEHIVTKNKYLCVMLHHICNWPLFRCNNSTQFNFWLQIQLLEHKNYLRNNACNFISIFYKLTK